MMPMFENIVAVIGMPRSGTSWLGQIFDSSPIVAYRLEPIFSYAFKNAVDNNSSRDDYLSFFKGIYESNDEFLLQTKARASGAYPIFNKNEALKTLVFKTTRFHNLIEKMIHLNENMTTVSIVRHPCGAINSWLKAKTEFPATADPMVEWRTGACRKTAPEEFWGFEDWKSVTRLHLRLQAEFPDRFILIKYDDLVNDTAVVTRNLFRFCGIPFATQTEIFLNECHKTHSNDDYAVYKSPTVKDAWKGELDEIIINEIGDDLRGSDLEDFL